MRIPISMVISMKDIQDLIFEHYGWTCSAVQQLEGYEDKTYRIYCDTGSWILKEHIAVPELLSRLSLENVLMSHYSKNSDYQFPTPQETKLGESHFTHNGKVYRALNYLEGDFLGALSQSDWPVSEIGKMLGKMTLQGRSLELPNTYYNPSPWDLQHLVLHKSSIGLDALAPNLNSKITYFIQQFEIEVLPYAYMLPKSFIHNDANEWNILLNNGLVSGLIDFGDACYSWSINELAVGLTYVLMNQENPLEKGSLLIESYCSVSPLEELEVQLLYYLVAGRICLSLCNSAKALKFQPDSKYISISAKPAENLLNYWIRLGPIKPTNIFRKAAGFPTKPYSTADTFKTLRKKHLSSALRISYEKPIVMEKAAFQYMYATDGVSFLDAYNNIMLVGHAHPYVSEQGSLAMKRLNTNTRYHYKALYSYSEKLLNRFPDKLSKIFLVNSGSAAADLAIRLARHYTGRNKIAALEYGYHGNTAAGISISHYKHRQGTNYPDTLICPLPKSNGNTSTSNTIGAPDYGQKCAEILKNSGRDLAAFIAEPIVGCGGQVPLPKEYLKQVYAQVRELGGLCVSDEVQVGFGRLGSHFWGFEMYDVIPDLVILGKPIGNGHPMGAVVCTEEIAESFGSGPEFFSSFGGNPVSCAIGEAVLEVIEKNGLQKHAMTTGDFLIRELKALQIEFPHIADVRGRGLFLGVELLKSNKAEATDWAKTLKNGLRNKHILIGTDGPKDNVLKIKPPLPFDKGNAQELTETIYDLLKEIEYY